jgi:hypothetical protein
MHRDDRIDNMLDEFSRFLERIDERNAQLDQKRRWSLAIAMLVATRLELIEEALTELQDR